ncbi:MAG: hypothetical protein ACFFG0_35900 [Candidatus Thorarchaeota archaeon]
MFYDKCNTAINSEASTVKQDAPIILDVSLSTWLSCLVQNPYI